MAPWQHVLTVVICLLVGGLVCTILVRYANAKELSTNPVEATL
jgi:uncharacterized protein YneF (UPF0154 family)